MDKQRRPLFAWGIWPLLYLLAASAPARAQDGPAGSPDSDDAMGTLGASGTDLAPGERPWAEGVMPPEEAEARKLFAEGNKLLKDSLFLPAVQKYREALEHWDHPGIHYNLSLALMNLDQPIEVYRSLQKAIAHGAAPLDADKLERAKSYLALVEKQLARVEIVCNEPDARVTMDGNLLFTAPGRHEGLVRVGEHTVVATKRGYLTENKSLALSPGQEVQLELELISLDDVTVTKRHWAQWKPWAVVGGGTAVALAGGVLHWLSRGNFNEFDSEFNTLCEPAEGCVEGDVPDLIARLDTAERQQQLAVTSYVIGGTALATGVVLLYLNRPRIFRRDIEAAEPTNVSFVPMLSPDVTGMSAAFRF